MTSPSQTSTQQAFAEAIDNNPAFTSLSEQFRTSFNNTIIPHVAAQPEEVQKNLVEATVKMAVSEEVRRDALAQQSDKGDINKTEHTYAAYIEYLHS